MKFAPVGPTLDLRARAPSARRGRHGRTPTRSRAAKPPRCAARSVRPSEGTRHAPNIVSGVSEQGRRTRRVPPPARHPHSPTAADRRRRRRRWRAGADSTRSGANAANRPPAQPVATRSVAATTTPSPDRAGPGRGARAEKPPARAAVLSVFLPSQSGGPARRPAGRRLGRGPESRPPAPPPRSERGRP